MSGFIRVKDGVGGHKLIRAEHVVEIIEPENESGSYVAVTAGDDGDSYEIDRDQVEDIVASAATIVPAAPGWFVGKFESWFSDDASDRREGITPEIAPLIGWRVHADRRVEPIAAGDQARHIYADRTIRGEKFPSDLVVIDPMGRGWITGQNPESVGFCEPITLAKWLRAYLEERREDECARQLKAQPKVTAEHAERDTKQPKEKARE